MLAGRRRTRRDRPQTRQRCLIRNPVDRYSIEEQDRLAQWISAPHLRGDNKGRPRKALQKGPHEEESVGGVGERPSGRGARPRRRARSPRAPVAPAAIMRDAAPAHEVVPPPPSQAQGTQKGRPEGTGRPEPRPLGQRLDALEDRGDAHAAADAQRHEAVLASGAGEVVKYLDGQDGARGPDRGVRGRSLRLPGSSSPRAPRAYAPRR